MSPLRGRRDRLEVSAATTRAAPRRWIPRAAARDEGVAVCEAPSSEESGAMASEAASSWPGFHVTESRRLTRSAARALRVHPEALPALRQRHLRARLALRRVFCMSGPEAAAVF